MNQYLAFFITHWELTILCIAAFVWVVLVEINSHKSSVIEVQPQGAIDLINKKSAQVFDLRKEEIFMQGHIIGAKRVDFNSIKDNPKTLNLSSQTTCLFVCNIGQTSAKIVEALRAKGYMQSYTLGGGMNGWKKEGLPLIQGK